MSKEKDDSRGKSAKKGKDTSKVRSSSGDEKIKFVIGVLIAGFALYLLLACIAYLFWWKTDLSLQNSDIISGPEIEVKNWSGKSGHFLAKMIIGYGFGFGAFFIPVIIATIGLYLLKFPGIRVWNLIAKFAFAAIILSLILSYIFGKSDGYLFSGPGGAQGYVITRWLNAFMGKIGTGIVIGLLTIAYLIYALKVPPSKLKVKVPDLNIPFKKSEKGEVPDQEGGSADEPAVTVLNEKHEDEDNKGDVEFLVKNRTIPADEDEPVISPHIHGSLIHDLDDDNKKVPVKKNVDINITKPEADDILSDEEVSQIMENYDPRLDLSRYKFPPVSILKEHKSESTFDNKEVFENKENIIKTLGDHKISIRQISATV
jgi:S-DNA-T family DNA segregation ATPase FtsK/SpoIIIE